MSDIRKVTDHFSVAPQVTPQEAAAAVAGGVVLVINNRPDGEAPDQPTSAEVEAAVRAAGADYLFIPVVGRPTPEQAKTQAAAVDAAKGPVLAFCRSGTRSITAWAMGEAASGASKDDLLRAAIAAGYDLRPVLQG